MKLIFFVFLCPSYKFCASANAYLEAITVIACVSKGKGFSLDLSAAL